MLKRVSFSGGVHIADRRRARKSPTVSFNAPVLLKIRFTEKHILKVGTGDAVRAGQLLANVNDRSAVCPLYSPVSGNVVGIKHESDMFGFPADFIIIANDGLDNTHEDIVPFTHSVKELQGEDIINIIEYFGIPDTDGLPLSAKLHKALNTEIKALIIGTGDSEGYITADERLLYEHPDRVVNGIKLLMYALKIRSAVIAVEEDKIEAINRLESEIDDPKMITVRLMKAKFPQCSGRTLVSALYGEHFPPDRSLAENGYVTLSAQTVEDIFLAFYHGMPYTGRRVTVCGDGIKKSKNIQLPIGTPVKDVIAFCGGLNSKCQTVIAGGAMKGRVIINQDAPVESSTFAVIALSDAETVAHDRINNCIGCGRCVSSCPMDLMPNYIISAAKRGDEKSCAALNITSCTLCGCCSFVCPSQIPHIDIIGRMLEENADELAALSKKETRNDMSGKSYLDLLIEKIKGKSSEKDTGESDGKAGTVTKSESEYSHASGPSDDTDKYARSETSRDDKAGGDDDEYEDAADMNIPRDNYEINGVEDEYHGEDADIDEQDGGEDEKQ